MAARTRLHFPRAMFQEPLPQADPHSSSCAWPMRRPDSTQREQRRGITAVLRSKKSCKLGEFPTLPGWRGADASRARCGVSWPEDTSFRSAQRGSIHLAVDLRATSGLTVEEVSKRLGYTDTSTFCHAFKRWHGVPPSAYPRTG